MNKLKADKVVLYSLIIIYYVIKMYYDHFLITTFFTAVCCENINVLTVELVFIPDLSEQLSKDIINL